MCYNIVMQLPQDDFILLSLVNTKLRDEYSSLEEFCEDNALSQGDICGRLQKIGYVYDEAANCFK